MSENLKTIRELADEFNVSKQAVRKRLTEEFRENYVETVHSNGVETLVVTFTGYMLLKQHFSGGNDSGKVDSNVGGNGGVNFTSDSKKTVDEVSVLKILEQQLAVKDRQLENKDSQISQMQNLLDQQQRLALQDKKILEEYKSEIKALKALNNPSQDIERDNVSPKETTEDNIQESPQKKNKKWWPFSKRVQKND
ncbi:MULTISPECIES: DNA-binding protein [Lactobacillales]|uniref:DNA-binding protein n=1 Tax=Lactobacillales TaxID=186826 RepID=UPI00186B9A92|nr:MULTISPECIES: DNA-binding protein [Lactobacillales]MBE4726735.1 DNA-binding protein [Leuconostoc citreum]MEB3643305.1 DNA-binding protein [Streptococcus salivarius]